MATETRTETRTETPCRIAVCTSCKSRQTRSQPGIGLITALEAAVAEDASLRDKISVAGVACMAGCDHPCTVGFHGLGKATYLFGDLTAEEDLGDILSFARQYLALGDGWCSSVDRPGKLRKSTLARVPATLFSAPLPNGAKP